MIVTRWQAPIVPDVKQVKMMFEAEGLEPFEETILSEENIPDHRHPFDEIRMVVEGELMLNLTGNKLLLRAGDKIVIPSNTKHSKTVGQNADKCICVCAKRAY